MSTQPCVAIVYDRLNKFGGAERVLLALRSIYPNSVLFTSVYDSVGASWVGDWEVRTSFLQSFPLVKRHHEWFALLMPWAFSSLDLSDFDIVVSVTSEFAKNVRTTKKQLHVCYCLTPIRYLWSHTEQYSGGRLSVLKRVAFWYLRRIDLRAAMRPDVFIAISKLVASRIKQYYGREAVTVIYPVTTLKPSLNSESSRSYFLIVCRLVGYKHVELAIRACLQAQVRLKIVGVGNQLDNLKRVAAGNSNIEFEGEVSDQQLKTLYAGARALLCPQEEDFGLVSLEAQMEGTPVISYARSGVSETVVDGKTAILFTSQTIAGLCGALQRFAKIRWNPKLIKKEVSRFSLENFSVEFKQEIINLWKIKVKELDL